MEFLFEIIANAGSEFFATLLLIAPIRFIDEHVKNKALRYILGFIGIAVCCVLGVGIAFGIMVAIVYLIG